MDFLATDITIDTEAAEALSENISQSLEELTSLSFQEFWARLLDFLRASLPTVGTALLLFVVGYVLIRMLLRFVKGLLGKSKADPTLYGFVLSTIKIVLYVILVITCVGILGVDFTPMLAMLGALGLALSLAVRDILSNIAGGISVLFSRPFAVEDFVEIGETLGTVKEIGIVYTQLRTVDNKKIFLPNGDVAKATIINYSTEPNRRLDLEYPIRDSADFQRAKEIILEEIAANPLALSDPAPIVRPTGQTYSYIKMAVLVWVRNGDLLELKGQLIASIRRRLSEEQLS